MQNKLIYDWPTRLFHWIFAGLFISSFLIAQSYDDESKKFSYHMILGLALAISAILRIIWGFFGSRYARFSSFDLNPLHLWAYFKNLVTRKTSAIPGHNPASSWTALIMLALALGLAVTGIQISQRESHSIEEMHEFMANAFILTVILHVGGVIFHMIRHRDNLGMSMVTGGKNISSEHEGIAHSHRKAGIVFLFLMVLTLGSLFGNYDPKTRQVRLPGASFRLGEAEDEEYEHRQSNRKKHKRKNDDLHKKRKHHHD